MNLHDEAHVALIRQWIAEMKAGDDRALANIMEVHLDGLLHLARQFLARSPQGAADAHDLLQSAFWSFVFRVRHGSFPEFDSPEQLWRILKCFVRRKAAKRREREARVQESQRRAALAKANARPATPAELTIRREELEVLLASVSDNTQRAMVRMRGAGYTNEEIAERFGITVRSVERNFAKARETLMRCSRSCHNR